MLKLEYDALCLPWLLIVGYVLSCNEVSTESHCKQQFSREEDSNVCYI